MNLKDKCRRCGSTHFIKIGKSNTRKGKYKQRLKCQDCKKTFVGNKYYADLPASFQYVPLTVKPQNWKAYTKAQKNHKKDSKTILLELFQQIQIPEQTILKGRKRFNQKDIIFCLFLKTFNQIASRRLHSELEDCFKQKNISQIPHFTVLMKYLNSESLTLILSELIQLSALPIKPINSKSFSVDATGFSTSNFGRWLDFKYGKEKTMREWIKCHAMIENCSNIVVNVEITDSHGADSPRFKKLVEQTSKSFVIKKVMADKAYSSRQNLETVQSIGAKAFIPFKKHVNKNRMGSPIWRDSYEYFSSQPQQFYREYHQRSNVETTFHMIKSKFGSSLKTKSFTGQKNEILLKILAHNISCLIHKYYEHKIDKITKNSFKKIKIKQKN